MKSFGSTLIILAFAGFTLTCEGGTASAHRIIVTGSSTVAPLIGEIAREYERTHSGVRVDVQTGGSSRGIADARKGLAHVGMVSRGPKAGEREDLQWWPVAGDGICIIVHGSNPIAELSRRQVVDIYRGQIKNWKEIGGPDRPISVVNKAEGRSTLEVFLKHFQLKNREIKASVVIGDNQQGIKTVAGNPGAIGYVSVGAAEYEAGQKTPIRLLPFEGVQPSMQSVADGSFPISRVLHVVTRGAPEGEVKKFLEFARSGAVHGLVRDQFFVPLRD
jgi:phosphate transport system substrate-binding protein